MQSIYIVDDDSDDLLFVKNAFDKFRHSVDLLTFNNGRELLVQLQNSDNRPSFILLDLNMPIVTGIEALKQIRSNKKLTRLNVIMFSTSNCPFEKQNCMDAGASDYRCKPVSISAYEELAENLLQKWGITESVK